MPRPLSQHGLPGGRLRLVQQGDIGLGGRAVAGSNPVSPIRESACYLVGFGAVRGRVAGATGSKRGPIVSPARGGERLGGVPWRPGELGCAELRRLGSGFAGGGHAAGLLDGSPPRWTGPIIPENRGVPSSSLGLAISKESCVWAGFAAAVGAVRAGS